MATLSFHAVTTAQEIFWLNFSLEWTFHFAKNFLWKSSRKTFHRRFSSAVEKHEVERCCPSLEPFHPAFSWSLSVLKKSKLSRAASTVPIPPRGSSQGWYWGSEQNQLGWKTDSNQHGNWPSMHLSSLLSASFPILAATAGSVGEAVEADVVLKESSAPVMDWAGLLWGRAGGCWHLPHRCYLFLAFRMPNRPGVLGVNKQPSELYWQCDVHGMRCKICQSYRVNENKWQRIVSIAV